MRWMQKGARRVDNRITTSAARGSVSVARPARRRHENFWVGEGDGAGAGGMIAPVRVGSC